MSVALPDNFKLLMTLRPYDRTSDPQIHIIMFKSMMLVKGATNPFLCQTFPTFLKKAFLL